MATIPPEKIAEVRERADIVDVVQRYVQLTKRGQRHVGLCPFHSEKTPSFGVSQGKQLFHCFGCGEGGDVFAFVMKIDGLDFPTAVRQLATESGISLPGREENPQEKARRRRNEQLFRINALVAEWFVSNLEKDRRAQTYLGQERGLSSETVRRFQLGWGPAGWSNLTQMLEENEIPADQPLTLGLIGRSIDSGRVYDKLRGRIIFPIHLPSGDVAGFGARRADWIDPDAPKYLNSPESPVYDKSSILYGLAQNRDEIRRNRRAILVEGYLDVIALWQADVRTAVAACGTALTPRHAQTLSRLTDEVVTMYDGDRAGQEATRKASELLLKAGMTVRVVSFPDGDDPDTYAKAKGGDAVKNLIDEAPSAVDFFLESAKSRYAGAGIAGAVQTVDAVKPMILAIRDPLQRDVAIEAAAQRLGLASAMFRRHLGNRSVPNFAHPGGAAGPRASTHQSGRPASDHSLPDQSPPDLGPPGSERRLPVVETALLTFLLDAPDATLTALESREALQAFSHPAIQAVFDAALSARATGAQLSTHEAHTLMQNHGVRDDKRLGMLRETLLNPLSQSHDLNDCVTGLLKQHKKRKLAELRTQSAGETDPEVIERLASEINKVMSLKI
ncbi:MAG: DNA primase [Myxococcota bacterium]